MAGAYFTEGKFLVHISFFLVARFWPEIEHVALLFFSVLRLLCLCAFCLYVSFGHLLEGLSSLLSFVVSNYEFVTFPLVSWVRCGTYYIDS